MKKSLVHLGAVVFILGFVGTSNAALWDRGGGLIYDDVLNITWLQDANYARTSGSDADGLTNWNAAVAWADGLAYYDSVRDVTWTDWRLPTTLDGQDAFGYNITTSEMGHMYYVNLGNLSFPQPGWGLANTGPFSNLISYMYWSETEGGLLSDVGWAFDFYSGYQRSEWQYDGLAWAVRSGDVSGTVPISGTVWLLGSGLACVGAYRRKLARRHG